MKYVFSFLAGYAQDVDITTYKKEWINLYSESAVGQRGVIRKFSFFKQFENYK